MNLSISASAALTAPVTWQKVRQNGFNLKWTARDIFWDGRMVWLRRIAVPVVRYKRTHKATPTGGYSWGFSASGHNSVATKAHILTAPEITIVDSNTAEQLLDQILTEVRRVVDDALGAGFL